MMPADKRDDGREQDPVVEGNEPALAGSLGQPNTVEEPEPPKPEGVGAVLREAWKRARDGRRKPKTIEVTSRGQVNDRSKAFLLLASAVVVMGFVFLAMFSTSSAEKRSQERRTKPSLGRPETAAGQAGQRSGSAVPLLSAEQAAGDPNADQLGPNDILATSRRTLAPQQQSDPPKARDEYALSNVPPVEDPALEAYRRQKNLQSYTPPPPAPIAPAAPAMQPVNDSENLRKPSMVFVRNAATATPVNAGYTPSQPAFIERSGTSTLLPTGSRLVARLQTAVSTAVKTPAIAVIEYNYERDGEIVVPAGTKAIGQLQQANQQGQVGIRFTTLQMPDGSSETIEGSSIGLDYGPLKGLVNGRN
ncbi:MAG: TrbI/VirB10 family protein, partial [Acidobacteria bacterium]|nr:TrbI/VirB10 family protein [Acidobacteriota bacterium]